MARLLAINPRTENFAQAVMADIKANIYDAAILITPVTEKPYALLAPMTQDQIYAARNASGSRKHRFYREHEFNLDLARDVKAFNQTRLFVDISKKESAIALGSLDCCVFFGVHYRSSRVWNETTDIESRISLSSGFRSAVWDDFTTDQKLQQRNLRQNSLYIKGLNL
jgi:hypothetical protein